MSHQHNYQHHHHHRHRHNDANDQKIEYVNIFDDLKQRKSILLSLFNLKENELINIGGQAPAPSKDYCQLILTYHHVIFRWWKITLRGDSETRYPGEIKDTYEDFCYDENIQRNIQSVFGNEMFNYIKNICEKGKLDYLNRLPEKILIKIVSNLDLESIAKLAQVNSLFRELCKSDRVWIELFKKYYSTEITPEMRQLAEKSENGWRKLFFTNKLKLQLELRRQAKKHYDTEAFITQSYGSTQRRPRASSRH